MGLTFTTLLLFKMFTGVAMVTTSLYHNICGGGYYISCQRVFPTRSVDEYSNYISDRNQIIPKSSVKLQSAVI